MDDLAQVGKLALTLVALALAVLAWWELRLRRVRRDVRVGRVLLVRCRACNRSVPHAWPHVNGSQVCAVCDRRRRIGTWRRAARSQQS